MKVNIHTRLAVCGLVLSAFLTGAAVAEIPDTFSNLEVFPKDIGKRQLLGAMRDFSTALGVKCTYCHIQKVPGDFDSIDWASDQLEYKKVSRGMMAMNRNINSELLPAATGAPGGRVTCITCHRGIQDPRTLRDVLLETIEKDGALERRFQAVRIEEPSADEAVVILLALRAAFRFWTLTPGKTRGETPLGRPGARRSSYVEDGGPAAGCVSYVGRDEIAAAVAARSARIPTAWCSSMRLKKTSAGVGFVSPDLR